MIFHTGEDRGFRNIFTTFPEHELTVIILCNFHDFAKEWQMIIDYMIKTFIMTRQ